MDKRYLITKSNKLITAKYDLSLEEQRIILTLASTIQPDDEDFKPYRFKINDFIKLLGLKTQTKYSSLPKITKNLMSKVIELRSEDRILQLNWLSSAEYKKGEGIVELEFSPKLKPYLLKLKEFFTSYRLENVLELKSKYAIRLYEILKSYEYKNYCEFEIEELKQMVGATEKAYKDRYNNFKNKVLLIAQQELKEKTDISFDFEEIKTGRKVIAIKFVIHSNNSKTNINVEHKVDDEIEVTKQNEEDTELIQQVKSIIKADITSMEAYNILKVANFNIELIKSKYEIAESQDIKNIVGWLIKAIQQDYQTPKIKNAKNSFNHYGGQRQYDIKKLEKLLLGRD